MSRTAIRSIGRAAGRAGALIVAATLFSAPAFANGGDFFYEFTANWNVANAAAGPSYFGFVRDSHGRAMPNATVSATIKPLGSSMVVQADILGHYKIPGFSKNIDPKNVVIGCSAPGYREVHSQRRKDRQAHPNEPIEVNCYMAPMASSS